MGTKRQDKIQAGVRVPLVRCTDPWTKLRAGALGTVSAIDDAGTVHVRWDEGGSLGLVPGEDEWIVLDG